MKQALPKYSRNHQSTVNLTPLFSESALIPFTGTWDFSAAAHLCRRTTYGATAEEISALASGGMEASVSQILSAIELPPPPVNVDFPDDPNVPIGESWINQPYGENQQILGYRRRSLNAWTWNTLLESGIHIREKLTLFWHNHFATQASVLRDPNLIFYNNNLLRANALGNFKELTALVTINPGMLRFLNGNQNSKTAPNENYARELLELFTVGKGALAGEGDYTTFTEQDVFEIAKALTGWRDTGYFLREGQLPGARFIPNRHDRGTKQLSHRFENAIIVNNDENEYKDVIDILFDHPATAENICRELYRWFVYYDITEEVETEVIQPMAQLMRAQGYDIQPVLFALFTSQHFYDICNVGPMIKNPIDFAANLFTQFEVTLPEVPRQRQFILVRIVQLLEAFQMSYYEPPDVAGWKAYYQEPLFYRTWITSATLPVRQQFTNLMSNGVEVNDFRIGIDPLVYISSFEDPFDPNVLIDEFIRRLLPQDLSEGQKEYLKEVLIPGLPDFEWTVEYGAHVSNPDDEERKRSVESKLRSFLAAFMTMPEYYLS